jgi:hypothetical protein
MMLRNQEGGASINGGAATICWSRSCRREANAATIFYTGDAAEEKALLCAAMGSAHA